MASAYVVACSSSGAGPDTITPPDDGGATPARDGDAPPVDDAGGGADASPDADGAAPLEPPTIVPGAKDRFLLTGTIVTPSAVILDGQVLVEGETITCVAPNLGCAASAGAAGATLIDTKGIIAPGLIDTHNHILFDIFDDDDWKPAQVYANHNMWPQEPRYQAMLDVKQCLVNDSQGKPAWCDQTPYGSPAGSLRCEVDKYGELKGLISGTTSIVGLPGLSAGCFSSLARSIDVSQNGLTTDHVQTSALFPPSRSSADGVCNNFTTLKTEAYLIHVGEGVDPPSLAEWTRLGTVSTDEGCLYAPQTAITHGTAFRPEEFAMMAAAGMKLTWSPRSNISLYNATTNIPAALDAGVLVSLGPDWSMGGSQNMLDEMRFAKSWSDTHWAGRLTAKDVVTMGTLNGAKVLALDSKIGRIAVGGLADIAVYGGDRSKPYDAIVGAEPKDVRLVMVGGVPLYGDKVLEPAAPTLPGCETLDVCKAPKFLCVATTSTANKLDQTYATIKATLEQALREADALTPGDGWNFAPLTPLVKCR